MDKSRTHQKVTKNGIEGWIVQEVWNTMVAEKRTEGFQAVASTPPEVQIIKQKTQDPPEPNDEEIVDPSLTGDLKTKAKPGPKPKA
jgi:hypothetical protein